MGEQGRTIKNFARIEMTLHNVIYISYELPHDIVRPIVPRQLPLAETDDGTVFISIVLLTSEAVHPTMLPYPRFTYEQINVRAYVRNPRSGEQAVYFLSSAVSSKLISLVTKSIGLTWEYRLIRRWEIPGQDDYIAIRITGKWYDDLAIEAESKSNGTAQLKPFRNINEAADYLIRPLMGFFGSAESLKRFKIWHPPVQPQIANLVHIDFPWHKLLRINYDLNLAAPHSVFLVKDARFYIYLPPAKVSGGAT
jgi:hypothetical protein